MSRVRRLNNRTFTYHYSVASRRRLSTLTSFTIDGLNGISVLIGGTNNNNPGPFSVPVTSFHHTCRLGIFSFFRLSRLITPRVRGGNNNIVLAVASVTTRGGGVGVASCTSSGTTTDRLIEGVTFSLNRGGVQIGNVTPKTVLASTLGSIVAPRVRRGVLRRAPVEHLNRPRSVTGTTLFLYSPTTD